MTDALIVPVNVQATCVIDPAALHYGPSHDFSGLPAWSDGVLKGNELYLSDGVLRFGTTTAGLGVRLHWSLPAALRHAEPGPDGTLRHPAAPNRWLVTRILQRRDETRLRLKSWVLESDHVGRSGQPGTATMAFEDGSPTPQFFRRLGRWTDLDVWREPGDAGAFRTATGHPLTAIGYGDATFAAYAPNCLNVFAFHDAFDSTLLLEDGKPRATDDPTPLAHDYTVSYTVVGWYSGEFDPLAALLGDGVTTVRPGLKWSAGSTAPSRTILSGAVFGLEWSQAGGTSLPAAPRLSLGATAGEALSALAAGGDITAEFTLNAVQAGLYENLHTQVGWASKLDQILHSRAFAPESGGWQWSVTDARDAKTGAVEAAADAEVVLDRIGAERLSALNAAQEAYDLATIEAEDARQQLYFDWYRRQRMAVERLGDPAPWREIAPDIGVPEMDRFLRASLDRLGALRKRTGSLGYDAAGLYGDGLAPRRSDEEAGTLAQAVRSAYDALCERLAANLRLRRIPGPRFWRPTDPVLLLQGDAARPPARDGDVGDLTPQGELVCRSPRDILTPRVGGLDLDLARLGIASTARAGLGVGDVADRLLVENLLLDGRADDILDGQLGAGEAAALRTGLQGGAAPAGTVTVTGRAPASLADTRGEVWSPVLLRWTARYRAVEPPGTVSDPKPFAADLLLKSHEWTEDHVDLRAPPAVAASADWIEYEGWSTLSSRASDSLSRALAEAGRTDPEAADLGRSLAGAPVMAQALQGLTEAFAQRHNTLQLAVFDPAVPEDDLVRRIRDAVGVPPGSAPSWVRPSAALRSGFLELSRVSIVDVFGRETPIATDVTPARSLRRTDAAEARAVLPPRFTQPARLQFRWLAAGSDDEQANGHPARSPISGWVVANTLEASLTLFDADGDCLGSLRAQAEGPALWRAAPQSSGPAEPSLADREAQAAAIGRDFADPDLRAFALALHGHPGGYLESLLRGVDAVSYRILPRHADTGPITIMGRPLVLVRASLALQFKGQPRDEGWQSLREAVEHSTTPTWSGQRNDAGLRQVRTPVTLGAYRQAEDGLVGYFVLKGRPEAEGYATFFAPGVQGGAGGAVRPAEDLTMAAADPAVIVSLLLDPRAAVHAATGILPVKSISIPDDLYRPALASLSMPVFAGPLLTPAGGPSGVTPRLPGYRWRWRTVRDGTWSDVALAPAAAKGDLVQPRARLDDGWAILQPEKDAS